MSANQSIKKIGILGAGRSAGYLIEYLGEYCARTSRELCVFDRNFDRLKLAFRVDENTALITTDLGNAEALNNIILGLDLVVSVLPPAMHLAVAQSCLRFGSHLFTASYTSNEMSALGALAAKKGLLFMNELGLDPGIDHLSASRLFDRATQLGCSIEAFESHCGGLVSLDSCGNNPWQYKFTWNPTNVVLAGQGGESVWKEGNTIQRRSWDEVFAAAREIEIPGLGTFDVYPNRNSLTYETLYGLESSKSLLRGTLRRNGYCKAWNLLVARGFTESQQKGTWTTVGDWFFDRTGFVDTDEWVASLDSDLKLVGLGEYMQFLRLHDGVAEVSVSGKTSAQILEFILLDRWRWGERDIDEVVMVHQLDLLDADNRRKKWYSVLQVMGEGGERTAMAKTVGLPLAMGVETFLEGMATGLGADVPFDKSWYLPILQKLENQGIVFKEYLS